MGARKEGKGNGFMVEMVCMDGCMDALLHGYTADCTGGIHCLHCSEYGRMANVFEEPFEVVHLHVAACLSLALLHGMGLTEFDSCIL